jgi:hypothetical protein
MGYARIVVSQHKGRVMEVEISFFGKTIWNILILEQCLLILNAKMKATRIAWGLWRSWERVRLKI